MTDPGDPPATPPRDPAAGKPETAKAVLTGLAFGLSAAVALAAAVFSFANTLVEPRLSPGAIPAAANNQPVIRSEAFVRPDVVREQLGGAIPPSVRQAIDEYNRGALVDVQENTQDFNRLHAPGAICANAGGTNGDTRAQAIALFGRKACDEPNGPMYSVATPAIRTLVFWNAQPNTATGQPWSLPAPALKQAAEAIGAAESSVVACTYTNPGKSVVKLTPAVPGYVPVAVGSLVLNPGAKIVVPLVGSDLLGGAQVVDPICAADFDLAAQELRRPYPAVLVFASIAVAVLALFLGMLSVARGWASFKP